MKRLGFIKFLHRHPVLFNFIASILIPGSINREFSYNSHMTLACIKAYSKTLNKKERSVWHNLLFPSEIFHSMNISSFVFEMASSILAKFNVSNRLISSIECAGLTRELCSFQKCAAGAVRSGLIPSPDMIVTSSELCDSIRKIGEFYDKSEKHFYLDVPFDKSENSIKYVKEQLEDFIKWLEFNTGMKYSEEKLRRSLKYSNQLRKNMIKVMELRRDYPGIMGAKPVFGLFNFNLFYGSPQGVKISEILLAELRKKSRSFNLHREQTKILWLYFVPFYKESFTEVLKKNESLAVVFEEMNNIYWEELSLDDPLEGLAKKIMSSPFFSSSCNRVDKIMELCDFFDIHGAVHFSQSSCRKINGGIRLIKDALSMKNIPLLELSGDCIDSRNYSDGQLKTRLEAFIEMFDYTLYENCEG